jgi:hypothetical protein
MRKPGTNENDVQMSDVLCDFCRGEWTLDRPMIEGHHGSCICGECLSAAYAAVELRGRGEEHRFAACTMCLESAEARSELGRGDEPCWQRPGNAEAAICRRCIKLAAGALHKDRDVAWTKPG